MDRLGDRADLPVALFETKALPVTDFLTQPTTQPATWLDPTDSAVCTVLQNSLSVSVIVSSYMYLHIYIAEVVSK